MAEQRGTDQGPAWVLCWELGCLGWFMRRLSSQPLTLDARRLTLAPAAVARYTFVIVSFTPVTRYRLYLV